MFKLYRARLWWNVVFRNWLVYRKNILSNISPTILDPIYLLVALGVGLSPFLHVMGERSYVAFLAPGLVASLALFTAYFETTYSFYHRLWFEGTYDALLTTALDVSDMVIGELFWVGLKGAAMSLGAAFVLKIVGFGPPWENFFWIPLVGFFIAVPCGAIGLLATATIENLSQFQSVYSFIIAPFYFFSGVFFPIEKTPWVFQTLVHVSPFFYGVQWMHQVFWGTLDIEKVFSHIGALCLFGIGLGWLAQKMLYRRVIL